MEPKPHFTAWMYAAEAITVTIGGFVFSAAPLLYWLIWLMLGHLAAAFIAATINPAHDYRETVLNEGLRKVLRLLLCKVCYFADDKLPAINGWDTPLGAMACSWFYLETLLVLLETCDGAGVKLGPLNKLMKLLRVQSRAFDDKEEVDAARDQRTGAQIAEAVQRIKSQATAEEHRDDAARAAHANGEAPSLTQSLLKPTDKP